MSMKRACFIVLFAVAVCSFAVCTFCSAQETAASKSTLDNLQAAYNAESNASARYQEFAKKANLEGYDAVAMLFRATALAEEVHYKRHADLITKLGGTPNAVIETPVVKGTKENLEAAIKDETYENSQMYPEFLAEAQKEGIQDAIEAFSEAQAAEASHVLALTKLLDNLGISKGLTKDFYVCPRCGNIVDAITFVKCPVCGTDKNEFKNIR